MFITRKRLEDIKANERWKHENRLNREREMSDMWERIRKLEHKVAMLENELMKTGSATTPDTLTPTDNVPIYTPSTF